ncbi:vWA domain-containing protein [Gordonia sputi]|uniref:vWA domain-containing protein n=2 Tax=Gordonia TaxID=2053 RepID=UPI0028AAF093|nr:VWA domain-containing protein [Gordonia sputi]
MRGTWGVLFLSVVMCAAVAACSTTGTPSKSGDTSSSSPVSVGEIPPTALIVDASDSMLTSDAPGPRIDAAKTAANSLVDSLPNDSQLALIAYGTGTGTSASEYTTGCRDIRTLVPLATLDKNRVHQAVDSITPRGFTPIAASLTQAATTLPPTGPAAIVLVSDGEDTCGQPPCPVARSLVAQHPDLQISTIGFKTSGEASDQLRCVAAAGGGLFVQAANAAQLQARLLATQNQAAASSAINGGSLRGIAIGNGLQEIRQSHSDFPLGGRRAGNQTIIVWQECEWVFDTTGRLVEIRPQGNARTIDGVRVGGTLGEAKHFYGNPVATSSNSDGTRNSTFVAEPDTTTGYRITSQGADDASTITRIVVCGCAPSSLATSSAPASEILRPFTKSGNTTPGWLKDATHNSGGYYACTINPVPGAAEAGISWCSGSSGMDQGLCAPSFDGHSLLCVTDPFSKTEFIITPSQPPTSDPKPPANHIPFGLELADGTRCIYVASRGVAPGNSARPDAVATYNCGDNPLRPTSYVFSDKNSYPLAQSSTGWTAKVGGASGESLRDVAISKVIYVGFG